MTSTSTRLWRRLLPLVVPVGFFVVFFAYPLATILGRSLVVDGHVDTGAFADVLGDAYYRHVAWFTLWQATLSTALTLVIGLPAAFAVARFDFPGKRLLRAVVTVPFVLPTIVVASAFLALLGPNGPLGALGIDHGLVPILLAHVFFNLAIVVRVVGGTWARLDRRPSEAARVLGAGPFRAFTSVTLPALRPAITAAASIVFLFTFTSFGVVLFLGGPATTTLEVEIYRRTSQLLDLRTAAVLSIVQLLAVTVAVLWFGRADRRLPPARLRAERELARRPRDARTRLVLVAILVPFVTFLAAPLVVLVARSLSTADGIGFDSYRALGTVHAGSSAFPAPTTAIRNSLVIASITTVLALAVGGIAALAVTRREAGHVERTVDRTLMLPLGASAVTIGFGFLVALDRGVLDLRTSPLILPIAHALIAVPFVVRVVAPTVRAIDPRLREAAAVLGASPARTWRAIDLPITARAFGVAAGFAFAISLGEFGATAFLARPDFPTLPIVIQRLLGLPGASNFGQAMAASTILMLLAGGAILVFDRFRVGEVGTF
ncbi:MAG: iron ABC transporter permease [Acidimicrobiia bacterium]